MTVVDGGCEKIRKGLGYSEDGGSEKVKVDHREPATVRVVAHFILLL